MHGYAATMFPISTLFAILARTANPMEMQKKDPSRFNTYVEKNPLEDNDLNLKRNIAILEETLRPSLFPNIKDIIRQAHVHRLHMPSRVYT